MNANVLIESLAGFPAVLREVVRPLSDQQMRWKPESGAWSALEIIRHLGDEEVEDFRMRLRVTLEDPAREWPAIAPERAAIERNYNAADPENALARFERERDDSVRWLRTLAHVNWAQAHVHPKLGTLRTGDLLASWTAHDMLHLRQLAKRRFEMIEDASHDFSTAYAGAW